MAKPCIVVGCPHIVRVGSRCPQHQRGTVASGYGAEHKHRRAAWAPRVAGGRVHCARCGKLIAPHDDWDLDHRDDRSGYLGPSHRSCNRAHNFLTANNSRESSCATFSYTPPDDVGFA
jgi:hypothetical protein